MEKQIIGHGSCSGCGRNVNVKVNKNGKAYYYCTPCGHHERFGGENTEKLKQQFNGSLKDEVSTEKPAAESGNTDGNGENDREPRKDKFLF